MVKKLGKRLVLRPIPNDLSDENENEGFYVFGKNTFCPFGKSTRQANIKRYKRVRIDADTKEGHIQGTKAWEERRRAWVGRKQKNLESSLRKR